MVEYKITDTHKRVKSLSFDKNFDVSLKNKVIEKIITINGKSYRLYILSKCDINIQSHYSIRSHYNSQWYLIFDDDLCNYFVMTKVTFNNIFNNDEYISLIYYNHGEELKKGDTVTYNIEKIPKLTYATLSGYLANTTPDITSLYTIAYSIINIDGEPKFLPRSEIVSDMMESGIKKELRKGTKAEIIKSNFYKKTHGLRTLTKLKNMNFEPLKVWAELKICFMSEEPNAVFMGLNNRSSNLQNCIEEVTDLRWGNLKELTILGCRGSGNEEKRLGAEAFTRVTDGRRPSIVISSFRDQEMLEKFQNYAIQQLTNYIERPIKSHRQRAVALITAIRAAQSFADLENILTIQMSHMQGNDSNLTLAPRLRDQLDNDIIIKFTQKPGWKSRKWFGRHTSGAFYQVIRILNTKYNSMTHQE